MKYEICRGIFKDLNSEETTILQPGDILAYYKEGLITVFRPGTTFVSNFSSGNPGDKLYFPLPSPSCLFEIACILSVATGLDFRKTDRFPPFENAYEFLKR